MKDCKHYSSEKGCTYKPGFIDVWDIRAYECERDSVYECPITRDILQGVSQLNGRHPDRDLLKISRDLSKKPND